MSRIMCGVLAAALLLGLAACASSGGVDGDAVYRERLGLATQPDTERIVRTVFNRAGFQVNPRSGPPIIMYESNWRERDLFPDERGEGIVEAETRLLVEGRQRTDTIEGGQYFSLIFMVENRTRVSDGEWRGTRNTPQFLAYVDEIKEDFESELSNIGVRQY